MDLELQRGSGILLHPTSLPGKFGIGTLGKEAFEFVDFLKAAGQKFWNILPLGPTGYGDSPYQCFSAFAGNPLLISLEKLQKDGWLSPTDLILHRKFSDSRVEFGKVIGHKIPLLEKAYSRFLKNASHSRRLKFDAFCHNNRSWLDDYSLFMALKDRFGGKPWWEWDSGIRARNPVSIRKYRSECGEKANFYSFLQYLFQEQWFDLHLYAKRNGIRIIGDIPIFVAYDSADAWSNPGNFHFNKTLKPVKVAGVPPDYFSATGQLWGNPLYNWNALRKENFRWWIARFRSAFTLTDLVRLDHFRGFEAYWAVPFGEKTAVNGKWEKAPGEELFLQLKKTFGETPIIAEDLGVITPDVEKLRDDFHFPGMKVLQFAFDSDAANDHLPHRYRKNSVVYTGTHDNDTALGWFKKAKADTKRKAEEYLGAADMKNISWKMIRAAWSSVAAVAIAPLQDVLALGNEARMNLPGTGSGNWQWRYRKGDLGPELAKKLKKLSKTFER
jgi:4-alpha-glucanotransferase